MNSSVLFLILLQNLAYLLRISTISNRLLPSLLTRFGLCETKLNITLELILIPLNFLKPFYAWPKNTCRHAWSYTSVPMSHPFSVDISVPFAGLRFQFDARFEKIFLLQPQYAWIPQTLFLLQGRSSTMMLQTCSELKPWQHKWPQLCILQIKFV